MKTKWVVLVCYIISAHYCFAQKSFYSGAFVINANLGIAANATRQQVLASPDNAAQTLNGTAASSDYSLGAEFGLFNWLGVGFIARIDNYFTQQNQTSESSITRGATDIGATGNIHIIKWKHLDAFAGYDFGIASITYNSNSGVTSPQTTTGTWSDIHATGRFYFNRFGFNLSLYVPGMSYNNFRLGTNFGQYTVNNWKSTGYGASLGLQYRIL
jgi:hypothetical protein